MYDVFIMDMGGHDDNVHALVQRFPHARVVRYYDNHLNTLKRCVARCRTPYAWVLASCCDYTDFDFDYRAAPWEAYQLHCWASNQQKFGDTFLINIQEFEQQQDIELLEWYKDVNWHADGVPRLPWPTVTYDGNNLVSQVRNTQFTSLYSWFVPDYLDNSTANEGVCLWTEKQREIDTFTQGNSLVLVPKDVKNYLKTQLYDYPSITSHKQITEPNQDIIFISYDEAEADVNWQKLKTKFPHAQRLHGVKGMEMALLRAAEMSTSPWYWAVFAKTEIVDDFEFDFQPDRLQQPKHYIFYALNEANGLEYGYAGVILYNVDLVKQRTAFGVDYTMSSLHAVVPVRSAIAKIGATPYQAWRSAFRESAKLAQIYDETQCVETAYRLKVWTTHAQGPNSEWILRGAADGQQFYTENQHQPNELTQAFQWEWLAKKFAELYPEHDQ